MGWWTIDAHEGAVRARHLEAQTEQVWCLTLVTNAVVAWTTEYYRPAVEAMRVAGRRIDDELLAYISPASTRHSVLTSPAPDVERGQRRGHGEPHGRDRYVRRVRG